MASNYQRGHDAGSSSAMPAVINLLKRISDAKADSAEWKEQHENLLAMYRASEDANANLRTSLAVAERDAQRYRWLRDRPCTIHFDEAVSFQPQCAENIIHVHMIGNTELDAAIDAAALATKERK